MSGPLSVEVMVIKSWSINRSERSAPSAHKFIQSEVIGLSRFIFDTERNYGACLIYNDVVNRTAVGSWRINMANGRSAAHKEGRSDERPSQNTHRSHNRPMCVIGEWLFDSAGGGDRETAERI